MWIWLVSVRKNNRYKSLKGFVIAEIMVALAVLAIALVGITLITNKSLHIKKTAGSIQNVKKIQDALDVTFREAFEYNEKNCFGWGQGNCVNAAVTPASVTSTSISVWLPTITGQKVWTNAGCTLTQGVSNFYTVSCGDGYGNLFQFLNLQNGQTTGNAYVNGYNRVPYSIEIKTTVPGGTTIIGDTWDSGHLDSEYYEKSMQKLLTLAKALKDYHFNRLTFESNNVLCTAGTGGLSSTDDNIIPWVWQSLANNSTNAQTQCSGETISPCGCSTFNQSIWSTLSTDAEVTAGRIIVNLGIDSIYQTDGFGNVVTVRVLVNKDGSKLTQLPSSPMVSYSNCLLGGTGANCSQTPIFSQLPPYTGQIGVMSAGSFVFSYKIIYTN